MQIKFNPRTFDRIKYENQIKTETELAQKLGVERATLRRWRLGETAPSFNVLAKIALEFKIPFDDMALTNESQQKQAA